MIAVSNSTPLIHLGRVNKLYFLKELYGKVYIPLEVWRDIMVPLDEGWEKVPDDIPQIKEAEREGWLILQDPKGSESLELIAKLSLSLGLGESSAIALAKELEADFLLINDQEARGQAAKIGVKTKWVAEVLHNALRKGLLRDVIEYENLLRAMVQKGLWMTKTSFEKAVEEAKGLESKG